MSLPPPKGGSSPRRLLPSLSPGERHPPPTKPRRKLGGHRGPLPTPQAPAPARAWRPGRGEPPRTFDRIQIIIVEEDGEVELVLGAALPAVGVGLLLRGIHGAQGGGRAAGWGARAGCAFSRAPRRGVARWQEASGEAGGAAGSLSSWGRTPGPGMARLAQRVRTRLVELSRGSGVSFLLREAPVAALGGGRRGQAARPAGAGPSPGDPGEGGRERRAAPVGQRPRRNGGRRLPCPHCWGPALSLGLGPRPGAQHSRAGWPLPPTLPAVSAARPAGPRI